MNASAETDYHVLSAEKVLSDLMTCADTGLSEDEALKRFASYGKNILKPQKQKSPLERFLIQFHQPLIYILLAASLITVIFREYVDSGVIFGVVLLNAIVGFLQEAKALKAIDALKNMMSTEAMCVRSGNRIKIPTTDLVPGDIVFLQSGDKVPADMRLIKTRELQIDESALTGESLPVEKNEKVLDKSTVLADRKNMAYSGTLVTYGTATGCIVHTGQNTEIGEISELIENTKLLETPLTRKISQFSHTLLYVILAMAGITFLTGTLRGEHWFEMFMAAVALAVGAIPEGLPAAVTIMLAIGVSRMAKKNAIIRKLPAVETLGCTTVICSDKTGTLTQNQMTVQEVSAGNELYYFSGSGYNPHGNICDADRKNLDLPLKNKALEETLIAGYLCNDSELTECESKWKVSGDPTEGALLVSAMKLRQTENFAQMRQRRIDAIPFESHHQYMAVLCPSKSEQRRVYLKGSVESVTARCCRMMDTDGALVTIDSDLINKHVHQMAEKGLRVLAFAMKDFASDKKNVCHSDVKKDCVFLGLQAMMDPPRPEVIEAVKACHQAGIDVKMITGDHAVTGAAIAEQIGLCGMRKAAAKPKVLTGKDMETMDKEKLLKIVSSVNVFARVTPVQKLELVEMFQTLNHVVAMTGDGVNDAPALRRAEIGIAMGITGTEVSKEAADMVLTNDDFTSIKDAVEEGRGVFDNLVKFITWTLPTNLGEGLVIMVAVIFGFSLPILPVQILWINMTTALLLGLTLTFEPKEYGIMRKPPRDSKAPILSRSLVERMILVAALMLVFSFGLFYGLQKIGADLNEARTAAVNVFVMIEICYLFNCRSLTKPIHKVGLFSNAWTIAGAGLMILLQVLFNYHPLMNKLFHTQPPDLLSWLLVGAAGLTVYFGVEMEKNIRCCKAV